MKILCSVLLITLALLICTCGKKDTATSPAVYDFQAISLGVGGDCQLCMIKFLSNHLLVDSIIGIDPPVDTSFYALNIPLNLTDSGTVLQLSIRKPLYLELPVCKYKGPSYNSVYVINAIKK